MATLSSLRKIVDTDAPPSIRAIAAATRKSGALLAAEVEYEDRRRAGAELDAQIKAEIAARRDGPEDSAAGRRITQLVSQRDLQSIRIGESRRKLLIERGPFVEAVRAAIAARVRTAAMRVREGLAEMQAGLAELEEAADAIVRAGGERTALVPVGSVERLAVAVERLPR